MRAKAWLMIGAILGFAGVVIGAFAAHGLKAVLDAEQLQWVAKASQYHMYHTLALLAVALMMSIKGTNKWLQLSAYGFGCGVLLFSGSLYALALSGTHWLVYLTPLGGLAFLFGWLCLFIAAKNLNH